MAKGPRGGKRAVSNKRSYTLEKDGEVQLQGVGKVSAVRADKLKPGDRIMYNYGSVSRVVSVTPKGKSSVVVKTNKGERVRRSSSLMVSDAVKGTAEAFRIFGTE